tara:strand:- start:223 stop:393 length:171 start_codon:yes stop_codon:yes gene_type:complete
MTKQQLFDKFNSMTSFEEKISFLKSCRDDKSLKLNIEYDNIITKLYSDQQSESESA